MDRRKALIGLALTALPGTATAKPRKRRKSAHTKSSTGVDKVKLVRPTKDVTLQLTAGALAQFGSWTQSAGNSSLEWSDGQWEDSVLISPGGGNDARIYSPDKTPFLRLKNYTMASQGDAEFLLPDSGGSFGSDPCQWFLLNPAPKA